LRYVDASPSAEAALANLLIPLTPDSDRRRHLMAEAPFLPWFDYADKVDVALVCRICSLPATEPVTHFPAYARCNALLCSQCRADYDLRGLSCTFNNDTDIYFNFPLLFSRMVEVAPYRGFPFLF